MRINIYLNEDNKKDEKIIKYLESKYNPQAYIKEILFSLANEVELIETKIEKYNDKDSIENIEVFEEIKGIDNIDL